MPVCVARIQVIHYVSNAMTMAPSPVFSFCGQSATVWTRTLRHAYRYAVMTPFERAMVVSYRLSIVTVALSVTIRPQFAIECLRRSNQQGGESILAKISGCSPWSRPLMFGSAESEHSRLTNYREIISEEFRPM